MNQKKPLQTALQFDVIVVYSGLVASSATDPLYTGRTPFSKQGGSFSYNKSYAYFLQYCKKQGLRAAFATTNDVLGSGLFRAVWVFDTTWKRKKQLAQTHLIFDKFSGIEAEEYKQSNLRHPHPREIQLFHNEKIRDIFDNKLKTFTAFTEHTIPTVKINLLSEKNIIRAKKKLRAQLKNHKYAGDFSDTFVLKDQFGGGGENIFKVTKNKNFSSIGKKTTGTSFLLQPFIEASGFQFGIFKGNIDLRLILCNGAIVQSYIRIPKQGEFRANASQGGQIEYLNTNMVPADVLKMSKAIIKKLPVQNSLYSLDFIKSSMGHLYFIEGNSTPGLNWFDKEDELRAKQLMRLIIQDLKAMA